MFFSWDLVFSEYRTSLYSRKGVDITVVVYGSYPFTTNHKNTCYVRTVCFKNACTLRKSTGSLSVRHYVLRGCDTHATFYKKYNCQRATQLRVSFRFNITVDH
jgi:hypothetical protein